MMGNDFIYSQSVQRTFVPGYTGPARYYPGFFLSPGSRQEPFVPRELSLRESTSAQGRQRSDPVPRQLEPALNGSVKTPPRPLLQSVVQTSRSSIATLLTFPPRRSDIPRLALIGY